MNKEFHYWITGIIANHAGFSNEEAQVIAQSSQFVDDNDSHIEVYDNKNDNIPSYTSNVSQTMNILLPKKELMKIYPIFHFIPGDQAVACKRTDGKTHPLNTTPDSSYAQKIMEYSLQNVVSKRKSEDKSGLHRLGIAIHAYADTWAHQNFVGWFSDFNAIAGHFPPNIGHADAVHHPDMVSHRWDDPRLVDSNVNNNLRFLAASQRVYQQLLTYWRLVGEQKEDQWNAVKDNLTRIFDTTYSGDKNERVKERESEYKKLAPFLAEYDANEWTKAALNVEIESVSEGNFVEKYVWKNTKEKAGTDWYKFQESVKDHLICAGKILEPAFKEAGINN